jgi:hypothetical protein
MLREKKQYEQKTKQKSWRKTKNHPGKRYRGV